MRKYNFYDKTVDASLLDFTLCAVIELFLFNHKRTVAQQTLYTELFLIKLSTAKYEAVMSTFPLFMKSIYIQTKQRLFGNQLIYLL